MNFRKALLGAGIGASALAAGIAHALPPTDYDANVLNVYFGGATATDNILENNFLLPTADGGICAPGTISIYRVTTANRGNRVIFCRVTSAQVAGFPASNVVAGAETGGRKVAFHKESIGGSSNGVVPLINQTNLEFFNMSALSAGTISCGAPTTQNPSGLLSYTQYTGCTDSTVQAVPNGGVSDVEPRLSFPAPSAAEIARLNTVVGLDIVFGVPVSENLYRALQVAQGYITDDVTRAPTAKCVGGIDAPGCVPSLSRSQIRGLYTQGIANWDQLFVGNGTGTAEDGTSLTAATGVTAPINVNQGSVADNKVYVCRRVATSGSQASAEAYFLKQRCQSGVRPFVGGNLTAGTTADFVNRVTYGEASSDVRTCLAAHNTNKTWAIGVLSTEQSSASGWRMVGIDGAAPNIANVMNGRYDYFVSNTLNRRAASQSGAPTGETLLLLQKIEGNFGNVNPISAANVSFQGRPWGDGGLLARYSGALVRKPDAVNGSALTRDNPVNTQTKAVGSSINNCIDPVSLGNSAAGRGTLVGD